MTTSTKNKQLDNTILLDFLASLIEEGLSKNSRLSYGNDLQQYYAFLTQTYKLNDWQHVTEEHIEHFLATLHDERAKKTTVSRKMSALRKFHKYLKKMRLTQQDAMITMALPKKTEKIPDVLSEEDIAKLLDTPDVSTLQGVRDKAILELFYATGLRVSELCQLRLMQVHLDTRTVHIVGKGNKERITLLGEEAVDALEMYYQFVRPQFNKYDSDIVFLNRRGKAFTRQGIWKLLKELVVQSGITKHVTPHIIRHSVATHLLSRGMDLRMIQEFLGHEHLETTQIYTKVSMAKKQEEYMLAHPHARIEK